MGGKITINLKELY